MRTPSSRLIQPASLAVVVTALHKLVPQQNGPLVMLPTLCKEGRILCLAVSVHRFADAQPKTEELVAPFVTLNFTQRSSTPWQSNLELHWEVKGLQVKHFRLFGWGPGEGRVSVLQLSVLQHWKDAITLTTPVLNENVREPVAGHTEDGAHALTICETVTPTEVFWIEAVAHMVSVRHVNSSVVEQSGFVQVWHRSAPAVLESAQMRVRERIGFIMMIR